MLEPDSFLIELTENFGSEILADGLVKINRESLEKCAAKFNAIISISHAKNFELNIHVPTISVRRIEKKGSKTETETLFFDYEDQDGYIVTNPENWGRVPNQIFG